MFLLVLSFFLEGVSKSHRLQVYLLPLEGVRGGEALPWGGLGWVELLKFGFRYKTKKSLSQYQILGYVKQGYIWVNSFLATALPASSSMGIISANLSQHPVFGVQN